MAMNERERWLATLLFQTPDRVPFAPGRGRESTVARWRREGLPEGEDQFEALCREIGLDPAALHEPGPRVSPGVDTLMIPQFEEKVIERRPNSQVVQDWKGNVCEIGLEFDVTYLRHAKDFVTRSWLKCPVENRADWEAMKQRYDLDASGRFPADFAERMKAMKGRGYPVQLTFSGPFWQLREWLGFEGLCMMLVDDPGLIHEMVEFWTAFMAGVLSRIFEHEPLDGIKINEDMAYKEKPMIGPDMCRRFLFKCWKRWADICRAAGVPCIGVDSDGRVDELIPVWIEAGYNWNGPMEVAAGNDLPAIRKRFGHRMAFTGGVDKRAMAKGGQVIRDEIARLKPVIDDGGYIPGCDHGVPSDVSWPNFVGYCRLLAEATGWL
jgi:uroporphyrinogen decarboxylase